MYLGTFQSDAYKEKTLTSYQVSKISLQKERTLKNIDDLKQSNYELRKKIKRYQELVVE